MLTSFKCVNVEGTAVVSLQEHDMKEHTSSQTKKHSSAKLNRMNKEKDRNEILASVLLYNPLKHVTTNTRRPHSLLVTGGVSCFCRFSLQRISAALHRGERGESQRVQTQRNRGQRGEGGGGTPATGGHTSPRSKVKERRGLHDDVDPSGEREERERLGELSSSGRSERRRRW